MAVSTATETDFQTEVLGHDGVVLVDFWAPWCGPCMTIAPVLEELSEQWGDKVKVVKVNTDENPQIAQKFSITSIPALYVFKGGEVVKTIIGAHPKKKIAADMEEFTS